MPTNLQHTAGTNLPPYLMVLLFCASAARFISSWTARSVFWRVRSHLPISLRVTHQQHTHTRVSAVEGTTRGP
jgi:hypothetical protein